MRLRSKQQRGREITRIREQKTETGKENETKDEKQIE